MLERLKSNPALKAYALPAFLVFLLIVLILTAGWLNNLRVFAFPLGTFSVVIIIPLILVAIAWCLPRRTEKDTEDQ